MNFDFKSNCYFTLEFGEAIFIFYFWSLAHRYHHEKKIKMSSARGPALSSRKKNKMNSAPVAQRYQTGNYQNSRNGKVEALLLT